MVCLHSSQQGTPLSTFPDNASLLSHFSFSSRTVFRLPQQLLPQPQQHWGPGAGAGPGQGQGAVVGTAVVVSELEELEL